MTSYEDPLEAADNPEVQLPEYFGQATVDAWFCVLEKGVGKKPFDPQQHTLDKRMTAIKVGIIPLPEQNVTRDIYREYIAEFGAWPKITLPSIKTVGLTVKSLNNAWVHIGLVSEGRTYTSKDGETKDSLTFKVLAVYPDEAACRAAYLNRSVSMGQEPGAPAQSVTPPAAPSVGPTNGNGHNGNGTNGNGTNPKERETALQFIKALVQQTNGDEGQLGTRIANLPMLARYFSIQSPEVRAILDAYHFEQMSKAA